MAKYSISDIAAFMRQREEAMLQNPELRGNRERFLAAMPEIDPDELQPMLVAIETVCRSTAGPDGIVGFLAGIELGRELERRALMSNAEETS